MSDWPEYESHKVVRATPIVRIDGGQNGVPIALFVAPDGVEKRFQTTELGMMARAEVGGYAVLYPDGYKSVSPRKPFEEGYTRK
jgi:hypothetical protein